MNGLRVLLIDDEVEFAETLAERLNIRAFHAEIATHGLEAMKRLRQADFDVVVLDVVLLRCRGLDLLVQIKEMRPQLPVILLSGRGSDKDLEEGKRKGAYGYLIKPVQIDVLIETMQGAVRSGRRSDENGPEPAI